LQLGGAVTYAAAMKARRSCLSVPARPARKLEKARRLAADEIVIDLEDSVSPDDKLEAREAVAEALRDGDWVAPTISVRVNGIATPWFPDDLAAIVAAGDRLDSVVVPKVEGPADLERCVRMLEAAERRGSRTDPVGLQALIESAAGLQAAGVIARSSQRLEALILGPADMSVSLGFPSPAEGSRWDFVRGTLLVAARAAGLQAIDGPYLQITDADGLRESAARARELGFDGKWALHPAQVEPIEAALAPTPEELARAEAILAALERGDGRGAVLLDGEMIDEASRKRARRILGRAGR
jgi:citrate lyase subunit beta/citryl-CoA lyase